MGPHFALEEGIGSIDTEVDVQADGSRRFWLNSRSVTFAHPFANRAALATALSLSSDALQIYLSLRQLQGPATLRATA